MSVWISTCLGAFFTLLWLLRKDKMSLGIPTAYLALLLFLHVPGALAHELNPRALTAADATEAGIRYTAIGAACFVAGVWLAILYVPASAGMAPPFNEQFSKFCLIGGWLFVYGLSPLHSIPSVGAVVDKGGGIWMLGVLLGLRNAISRRQYSGALFWICAMMVYPILMLLLGGFLSYGAVSIIFVGSALMISLRSNFRVVLGLVVVGFFGLSIFVNYFNHRDAIRQEVWGEAGLTDRIDAALEVLTDFKWFDPSDEDQALALDLRLNQNYFVGLASERLQQKQVDFLYGLSIWNGIEAFVPRIIWPEKPVTAGSGNIVAEMTGLNLSTSSSFGVGNVMEFYINFGLAGIIAGFLGLGFLIGLLDRSGAIAESQGNHRGLLLCFLPAIAIANPGVSIVEMAGGGAASYLAAQGWVFAWENVRKRTLKVGNAHTRGLIRR